MKLPFETAQIIEYRCNICNGKNRLESNLFHRELANCRKCGANARFRGIIHVLADLVGEGELTALQDWTVRKNIFRRRHERLVGICQPAWKEIQL